MSYSIAEIKEAYLDDLAAGCASPGQAAAQTRRARAFIVAAREEERAKPARRPLRPRGTFLFWRLADKHHELRLFRARLA